MADSQHPQQCMREHAGKPPASMRSVWRSYQRSMVRFLLLSYSGLSLVALSCLHWQAVGEYAWRLTDYSTVSNLAAVSGARYYRAWCWCWAWCAALLSLCCCSCGISIAAATSSDAKHKLQRLGADATAS